MKQARILCWVLLAVFGLPVLAVADSRYLVVFRSPSLPAGEASRILRSHGGAVERDLSRVGVAVATAASPGFAAAVAADPAVEAVGEERLAPVGEAPAGIVLEDPAAVGAAPAGPTPSRLAARVTDPAAARFFSFQWNLRRIRADQAWARGRVGDPAVTVAVVDSGIDYTHVDLVGKVDLARSVSFVPEDDALLAELFPGAHPIADLNFRGTHHAALIACNALAMACVAPNATLVGVKVIDASGLTSAGRIVAGILYSSQIGADVINLGFYQVLSRRNAEDRASMEAIRRAVAHARAQGAAVIAEAGFGLGGADADADPLTVIAPVQLGALGVSATDLGDLLAPATDWGRSLVDVAAPGGTLTGNPFEAILSACSQFSQVFGCARPTPQSPSRFLFLVGFVPTSPTVSGVAALVDAVKAGALRGHEIESVLRRTAEDLGPVGKDPFFGSGLVDALAATEAVARD